MVILVTGDRDWGNQRFIWLILDMYMKKYGKHELLIVQGGARGADTIAKNWAENNRVDYVTRWAHWDHFGKPAGPIRNHVMHDQHKPDVVLAFHPDMMSNSIGTYEMYRYAKRHDTSVRYFTGKEDLCNVSPL